MILYTALGEIDLAFLTDRWPEEIVRQCEREHQRVRRPTGSPTNFERRLGPAQLYMLFRWLGERWAYRNETWMPLYQMVPMDDIIVVADEVLRQLATFRALVGKDPTHLDSHQHVHLQEPVRSVVGEIARTLAVPLRQCSPKVHYCGEFYGQAAEGWPFPSASRPM